MNITMNSVHLALLSDVHCFYNSDKEISFLLISVASDIILLILLGPGRKGHFVTGGNGQFQSKEKGQYAKPIHFKCLILETAS